MARPVDANAEVTRHRILLGATRLFAERGQGQVSVRRVAESAGVSLGTVHHYFGTKDRLYQACVDAMYAELDELRAELVPEFLAGEASEALAARTLRRAFRFAWRHRDAVRLQMRTIIDTGHQEPGRLADVHLPFLAQASALIGATVGRPADEMRLPIQSVMHLVVRYALTDLRELALLVGVGADAPENRVLTAIEEHLVLTAGLLLRPSRKVN